MNTELVIREMTFDDIAPVAELLKEHSSETPWTANDLCTWFLRDDALFLVMEERMPGKKAERTQNGIVGFVGMVMSVPEADLIDVTLAKGFRNMGLGRRLLAELLELGRGKGVTTVHLEVRTGNAAARHLYKKLGFREDGIRKNYYTDPVEDAVTMTGSAGSEPEDA